MKLGLYQRKKPSAFHQVTDLSLKKKEGEGKLKITDVLYFWPLDEPRSLDCIRFGMICVELYKTIERKCVSD